VATGEKERSSLRRAQSNCHDGSPEPLADGQLPYPSDPDHESRGRRDTGGVLRIRRFTSTTMLDYLDLLEVTLPELTRASTPLQTAYIQRVVPMGNPPVTSVEPRLSARITPRATKRSPIPFDVTVHNCFITVRPLLCPFPAPQAPDLYCSQGAWSARIRHQSRRAVPPPRSAWRMSPPHPSVQSSHG